MMGEQSPPRKTRRPPPDDGVVVDFVEDDIGGRFLDALGAAWPSEPGRAARGRRDAHEGRVHGLAFDGRALCAWVTGTREHRVRFALARFSDDVWARVDDALARSPAAREAVRVGALSPLVETCFAAVGAPLLPRARGDVEATCTCSDDLRPCRHLVAAAYAIAVALGRDPYLLVKLRGRARAALLHAPTTRPAAAPATMSAPAVASPTTRTPAPTAVTTSTPPTATAATPAVETTTATPPRRRVAPAKAPVAPAPAPTAPAVMREGAAKKKTAASTTEAAATKKDPAATKKTPATKKDDAATKKNAATTKKNAATTKATPATKGAGHGLAPRGLATTTPPRVSFGDFDRAPNALPRAASALPPPSERAPVADPPAWPGPPALDEVVAPLYARAAAHARALLAVDDEG